MTELKGYCAKYFTMGSENTHVISKDHSHHDSADWFEEWHGKVHPISPMSTAWQEQGIASNTDLGARPNVAGVSQICTMYVKSGVQPMISEQAVPMAIEKIGLEKRKLPRMTGKIEGTQPELYKTEKNVTTRETYNIFELKDVWRQSEMSCDSPGIMNASLQPQTLSYGIDQPGHNLVQTHPQPSKEELWQQATKVTEAIASRSMKQGIDASYKADPDKAL